MNRKIFAPIFAAVTMFAGTLGSYGGETMKNELLTVRETAIVDLGAAVARGDQKNLAAATAAPRSTIAVSLTVSSSFFMVSPP